MNKLCPVCMQLMQTDNTVIIKYKNGNKIAMHKQCANILPRCFMNTYSDMSAGVLSEIYHGKKSVICYNDFWKKFAAYPCCSADSEIISIGKVRPLRMRFSDIRNIRFTFIPRKKGENIGTVVGDVRATLVTFRGDWHFTDVVYENMVCEYRLSNGEVSYRYLNRDFAELVKTLEKMAGRSFEKGYAEEKKYMQYITDPTTLDQTTAIMNLGFLPWDTPTKAEARHNWHSRMQLSHTDHGGCDEIMKRLNESHRIVRERLTK